MLLAMKVCPSCSFSNEERFPACLLCNTLLVDVPSTLPTDPHHPEFARRALTAQRHAVARRQMGWASGCYAFVVTLTAAYPGLMFHPEMLLLYCASSVVVVFAVLKGFAGQLSAGMLQGFLSVLLVVYFAAFHPFVLLMLAAHTLAPSVFWHWIEAIDGAHR